MEAVCEGDVTLHKRTFANVNDEISKNPKFSKFQSLTSKVDITPNQYEGGLKTWECAMDLVSFLSKNFKFESTDRVLELGCGSGLPGIFCLMNGCHVTLQDFNSDVLSLITIPNAHYNIRNSSLSKFETKAEFVAGDWDDISSELDGTFDYILSSETIYNPENYKKLIRTFKAKIKEGGTM
jgi:predicted nicotinamide N-methyase